MRRTRHGLPHPLGCIVALSVALAVLAPGAGRVAADEADVKQKQKQGGRQKERPADRQAGNSFLWKATSDGGGGNTVYLLGSIHVAREDFYPLPEEIERA